MVAAVFKMPTASRTPELSGWTQVFQAGTRRGNPYTLAELDAIVANYHQFKGLIDPPAVLGHSDEQPLLTDSGEPAAGWVADARRQGEFLEVRFADMPPAIKRLLKVGAFKKASAELYLPGRHPEGISATGPILRRVAFLGGGELPRIKTLADVTALWDAPESFGEGELVATILSYEGRRELPGGTFEVFFECEHCKGSDMDRKALEAKLIAAGWSEAAVKGIKNLPDADLPGLVESAERMKPAPVVPPVAPPVIAPVATVVPPPLVTPEQFAEMDRALKAAQAGILTVTAESQRLAAENVRRAQAERQRTVEAFCERWSREGYVLPREIDKGAKVPTLYHELLAADGKAVVKFGEAGEMTAFDAKVKQIEARGPGFARRNFSEQIEQPAGGKDDIEKEVKEYAARRNKKSA